MYKKLNLPKQTVSHSNTFDTTEFFDKQTWAQKFALTNVIISQKVNSFIVHIDEKAILHVLSNYLNHFRRLMYIIPMYKKLNITQFCSINQKKHFHVTCIIHQ